MTAAELRGSAHGAENVRVSASSDQSAAEPSSLEAGSLKYDVRFGDGDRIRFISALLRPHIFCDICV